MIITLIYWKTGFAWTRRGYEYTLMWGLISFAIALRGGGPYSLDRKLWAGALGKEDLRSCVPSPAPLDTAPQRSGRVASFAERWQSG